MGNSWKYKCPWCLLIYKMTILILLLVLFLKNTLHKIYLFIELFIFIIIYKYQAVTPERCIQPEYFVPPIWIDLQNGIQNCCASVNLTLGAKRQKTPTFFFLMLFRTFTKTNMRKKKNYFNYICWNGGMFSASLNVHIPYILSKNKKNCILKSRFWSYKLWLKVIILLVFGN